MTKYDMEHRDYALVAIRDHPAGVKVVQDCSVRPVKLHIEVVGRQKTVASEG